MTTALRTDGRRAAIARQRGVTLIELMVGLLIGMFATLVVAQVLAFAERYKRTTTGGSDAQVNGALALYTVQRDLQMAGYGVTTSASALGCEIRARRGGVDFTWSLAPLTIADGAGGLPDTINVMASSKPYSVPVRITVDHPRTAANFFVQSALGVAEGDLMIAVPQTIDAANWCSVLNATQDGGNGNGNANGNAQGANQVAHDPGTSGPWNPPGGQSIFPAAGYPAGSYLLNVGRFVNRSYAVDAAGTLTLTTFVSAAAASATDALFPHIANLQALYGKDTDADGVVDRYDNATPVDSAGWQQVLAVRVAVVARSAAFEKDDVTAVEPSWDVGAAQVVAGSVACGSSRCLPLKVDHVGADWKRYRYKVFDTVVPLRNLLWRS